MGGEGKISGRGDGGKDLAHPKMHGAPFER